MCVKIISILLACALSCPLYSEDQAQKPHVQFAETLSSLSGIEIAIPRISDQIISSPNSAIGSYIVDPEREDQSVINSIELTHDSRVKWDEQLDPSIEWVITKGVILIREKSGSVITYLCHSDAGWFVFSLDQPDGILWLVKEQEQVIESKKDILVGSE